MGPIGQKGMTQACSRLRTFVETFGRNQTEDLIANLQTSVLQLDLAGLSVPITVNDGGKTGNCYICNPVTGYIDYAIDETRNFVAKPLLQKALITLIRAVSPLMKATELDRAVHVNNWLFSTNPAPQIDRQTAIELRDNLTTHYPSHTIVLRSLNSYADSATMEALQAEGFRLVPSRQIYLFDGRRSQKLSRDLKAGQRLLGTTPHTLVQNTDFRPRDYARCAELYRLLYLEKYSLLNPQYSEAFIAEMHQNGLIQLEGLRADNGCLVAFGGRFEYEDTLTQPLIGYDTRRPQKEGLYRLITALAQKHAQKNNLLFNMSAGAASFKRNRQAKSAIEFSAVYNQHLPLRQRLAQKIIFKILLAIGVPLLKRFAL